jgi:hypothetical protein
MRAALGIFGVVAGIIVVALVGRYAFITSDTATDGAIAAFFFGAIAIGGIAGPAAAVHLFRGAKGWAKLWGILALGLALVALAVNLTNSLGAIAGRADKTLAERAKAADSRKDDRAEFARLLRQREAMPAFTPATAETVQAARDAVASAETIRARECANGDPRQRGINCRARETDEQAKRDALAVVLANKAATDRAAKLDSDAAAIRARLEKAQPVASVNPLADTLGRILSLPADTAATAQQVAMVVVVELLIAFALIAWELLAPTPEGSSGQRADTDDGTADARPAQAIAQQPVEFGDVRKFMLACLPRAQDGAVMLRAVYTRYQRWCDEQAPPVAPLEAAEFGTQFKAACERVKLRSERRGDQIYCLGVKLAA